MKNQIIIAIGLLTLIGCAKAPAPAVPSPAFASPNASESLLIGTWNLQQQVISTPNSSVTYTGYSNNYYITFYYGVPSVPDAITCKYYTSTWMPNTPAPPNVVNPTPIYGSQGHFDNYYYLDSIAIDSTWVPTGTYWYVNPLLTVGQTQSIMINVGGQLTVTWTDGNQTIVSTLN